MMLSRLQMFPMASQGRLAIDAGLMQAKAAIKEMSDFSATSHRPAARVAGAIAFRNLREMAFMDLPRLRRMRLANRKC